MRHTMKKTRTKKFFVTRGIALLMAILGAWALLGCDNGDDDPEPAASGTVADYYFYTDAEGVTSTDGTTATAGADGFTFYGGYEDTMTAVEAGTVGAAEGANGTDMYYTLTGAGGAWAAGGWNQAEDTLNGGKVSFDASAYNALVFWAKSDAATTIKFGIEDKGTFEGAVRNPEIARTIGTEWKEYAIPFTELLVDDATTVEVVKYVLAGTSDMVDLDEVHFAKLTEITSFTYGDIGYTGLEGAPLSIEPSLEPANATATYAITGDNPLPASLVLNAETGEIVATSAVLQPATRYTVTATGTGEYIGTLSADVTIAVIAGLVDISTLGLSYTDINITQGASATATPMWDTAPTGVIYDINPALPADISFDLTNGEISVSTDTAVHTGTHTVTATGTSAYNGNAEATISITISEATGDSVYYFYTDGTTATPGADGFTFYGGYDGTITAVEAGYVGAAEGANGTDMYYTLTGAGGAWAAGGWNQAEDTLNGGKVSFDASAYNALVFWAKSDDATTIKFGIEDKGTFEGAVRNPEIARTIGTEWKEYAIPFTELLVDDATTVEVVKYVLAGTSDIVDLDEIYFGYIEPAVTGVTIPEGDQSVNVGDAAVQLTATVVVVGAAADTVTWTTSNATVASVSSTGLVTIVGAGTATITATSDFDNTKSAGVTVTVSPQGTVPAVNSVTIGDGSATLTKITTDAAFTLVANVVAVGGASNAVTWASSTTATATVSATGEVTIVAAGTTTITATSDFDGTKSATLALTVNVAPAVTGVTIPEGNQSVTVGDAAVQLTATVATEGTPAPATTVTWTTSNATVASVSSTGLVTIVGAGTATITATSDFDNTKSAGVTVTVSPPGIDPAVNSVTIGDGSATLTKITTDAAFTLVANVVAVGGASQAVTWTSSNTAVATVSGGVVTIVAAGTTTITATSDFDGTKSATLALTVNVAPAVTGVTIDGATTRTATVGDNTFPLLANVVAVGGASQAVTWTSSNTAVATVHATSGLITIVGAGTTTITATSDFDTGQSASLVLTVNVAAAVNSVTIGGAATRTVTVGDAAVQLTATVDVVGGASQAVTWITNNGTVASVSSTGLVTIGAAGTATITAISDFDGTKSASVAFTVNVAPAVTSVAIDLGTTASATVGDAPITLTANVVAVGGASQAVTWSSSNTGVATVSGGVVTIVGGGSTNIIATSTFDNTKSATLVLSIASNIALQSAGHVTVTTSVTTFYNPDDNGTHNDVARGLSAVNDGSKDAIDDPTLEYQVYLYDTQGKHLTFTFDKEYTEGSFLFYNRENSGYRTRIAGSSVEFKRGATVVHTEQFDGDGDPLYTMTPAANVIFDSVVITFGVSNQNRQNFKEVEVWAIPN